MCRTTPRRQNTTTIGLIVALLVPSLSGRADCPDGARGVPSGAVTGALTGQDVPEPVDGSVPSLDACRPDLFPVRALKPESRDGLRPGTSESLRTPIGTAGSRLPFDGRSAHPVLKCAGGRNRLPAGTAPSLVEQHVRLQI